MRLKELRSQTQKSDLGSALNKDVWFRDDNIFICDIQLHILNGQTYGELSGNKVKAGKKRKHLFSVAAISVRGLRY
jgi:hypothetical protein